MRKFPLCEAVWGKFVPGGFRFQRLRWMEGRLEIPTQGPVAKCVVAKPTSTKAFREWSVGIQDMRTPCRMGTVEKEASMAGIKGKFGKTLEGSGSLPYPPFARAGMPATEAFGSMARCFRRVSFPSRLAWRKEKGGRMALGPRTESSGRDAGNPAIFQGFP